MGTKADQVSYSAFFDKIAQRIPGLHAALVTDRDGVVLVKATNSGFDENSFENSSAALFAVTTEQAGKLGLGKNKSIINFRKEHVIVHINDLPLVISFVASIDANVGMILALAPDLVRALAPLATSVASMEKEEEAMG